MEKVLSNNKYMKVAIVSDIHLEFWRNDLNFKLFRNYNNIDLLILAGDIIVFNNYNQLFDNFFDFISKEYPNIIYILGNHEFYYGDICDVSIKLKTYLSTYNNIHILIDEFISINNKVFFAGTMWTSFNKNPIKMFESECFLNDFDVIKNKNSLLKANDTVILHDIFINKLNEIIKQFKSLVVISHHAPTHESIDPIYKDSKYNDAFATELSDYILQNNNITHWIHGHLHNKIDLQIGSCNVICNPYGYVNMNNTSEFNLKIIEI